MKRHFEAYKLDGTFMWRISLGKNIRSGAAYCPFIVYDLDGDGKAEFVCRTADGTIDGTGKVIGDPNADWREPEGTTIDQAPWMTNMAPVYSRPPQHLSIAGVVISGPEYLTVFNGQTGAAMATVPYVPPRYPGKIKPTTEELTSVWGSGMGNNDCRFHACVAYLDGVHPSVVMCRGIYTRTVLVAWDWHDGKLTQRWIFDTRRSGHGQGRQIQYRLRRPGQPQPHRRRRQCTTARTRSSTAPCASIMTARGFTRPAWGMAMRSMSARSIPTARTCKSSTFMRFRRIPTAWNCMTPPPANSSGAIREK